MKLVAMEAQNLKNRLPRKSFGFARNDEFFALDSAIFV